MPIKVIILFFQSPNICFIYNRNRNRGYENLNNRNHNRGCEKCYNRMYNRNRGCEKNEIRSITNL